MSDLQGKWEKGDEKRCLSAGTIFYTPEAWTALTQNPEDRSAVVREFLSAFGGTLSPLRKPTARGTSSQLCGTDAGEFLC